MRAKPYPRSPSVAAVGYDVGPSVYVVQFSDRMVKVGVARVPRARLNRLAYSTRVRFGSEIERIRLFSFDDESGAAQLELASIRRLHAITQPAPNCREFFHEIAFDDVVALVEATRQAHAITAAQSPNT